MEKNVETPVLTMEQVLTDSRPVPWSMLVAMK